MAQELSFGKEIPGRGNIFVRVKQKGDKVQFQIAKLPAFYGKHFLAKENDQWDILPCPRINAEQDCNFCDEFFGYKAEIKKIKAVESVTNEDPRIKELDRQARQVSPTTEWYFPILNRETGKMAILQTTDGVRNQFNAKYNDGIDVMTKEWILSNTGGVGAQKYSLSMVDSADVKPLSDEERDEFLKAKSYDTSSIGNSQPEED